MKSLPSTLSGLFACASFLLLGNLAFAQHNRNSNRADEPNLYTGISSVVLAKDATEINLINSLNSFWIAQNEYNGELDAIRVANRVRYSRADHILRVSHGFSKNGRWDLGADLYYTRVRVDDEARSSPFRVYGDAFPSSGNTYAGISAIGIQARMVPFARLPELTLRAGMSYPLAKTLEQRINLNAQRTQFYLTGTFFQRLGAGSIGFVQGDLRTYLRNEENERSLLIPSASGYLVFELPGDRWFVFPGLSYSVALQQGIAGGKFRKANQQLFGSLGVQYQPVPLVSFLLSGQLPFIFDSGSTNSIWVRESYVGMNLGVRLLL